MNPNRIPWPDGADDVIRSRYGHEPAAMIARDLRVRAHNVIARAGDLGLRRTKQPGWTSAELKKLQRLYTQLGLEAARHFKGRTVEAVRVKAIRMGFSVGLPDTEARVTVWAAARMLGVDRDVIRARAERDGVLERAGFKTLVPERWLEALRAEYPNGSIGLLHAGYVPVTRAARLIGVSRDALFSAIRGQPGPLRDALEGITVHPCGYKTLINPHDVETIRRRLKRDQQVPSGWVTLKSTGYTGHTGQQHARGPKRHAMVSGRRMVIVPAGSTDQDQERS